MQVNRVELDNGKVVTVEHPDDWSEDQVVAFARMEELKANRTKALSGTDNKDDDVSTTDLLKLGLSRFAAQFVPDTFLMTPGELQNQIDRAMAGDVESAEVFRERAARRMAGIPQDVQLGYGEEVLAAFGDPSALAAGPSRAGAKIAQQITQQAVGKLTGPVAKTGETAVDVLKRTALGAPVAVTSTAAGTTAGMAAPEIVAELGGGQALQEISSIVAGAGAGGVTSVAATGPVQTGIKVLSDIKNKVAGGETGTLGVASEAMANSRVSAEINRIKETTQPSEITKAVENLASLKEEIPDLEIGGLVATLTENPIVRDWVKKTTQSNKAFHKELADSIARDAEKLSKKFDETLGITEPIERSAIEGVVKTQQKKQESLLKGQIEKQNENIDKAIADLTFKTTGAKDEYQIGLAANRLLDRKERQVRKAADSLYKFSENLGEQVLLADDQIMNVYSQFKGVRLSDLFGPGSPTATKLERFWSPIEVEQDGVKTFEFPEVKGTDVVSLKKAINREIAGLSRVRDKGPEQTQRLSRLYDLKTVVNNTLNGMAATEPQFIKSVRDADAFYYKELGLPLSAEGMREINAKKFDAAAASTLMNYEKARDYVNFVGKPGMAVVRHAVRLKAEKDRVVNITGQIDQKNLDQFIRKNRRLIEFAGLTDEFADTSRKLRTINNTAARHNEAYKERSKELSQGFFKAITDKNLNSVVSEMLSNPGKRKAYLAEINQLGPNERDMVISGLRQEFLSQGVTSAGTMQEFINKNREAVGDLFDRSYVANINKLAGLRDTMLKMSDLLQDSLGQTPVVDSIQEATGVSISEFAGTLRNQILSTERKVINLVAKSATTAGKDKFYTKSAEVLLDPDVVSRLANPPQEGVKALFANAKKGTFDYLKDLKTYYTDTLKGSINLNTIRAIVAAEQPPEEEK